MQLCGVVSRVRCTFLFWLLEQTRPKLGLDYCETAQSRPGFVKTELESCRYNRSVGSIRGSQIGELYGQWKFQR
ncbi:hypothetical protein ASPTUDRAFT_50719 [Aspergillus tubingensis CBS 134.48]|uniref:Uncharacterized protein n=1 Tax=Aspergillus tubingensis (strain CBS 134.48) TaxID=767770 RepID=A0A1L9NHV9_ASPTC|nr:hypothetical protein ASPTUDRAFT_50719 [Aspergillus tubingensis CBS 134.48]